MTDSLLQSKNVPESSAGGELLQLVSFRMGNDEFGVDILKVREINRMMEVTRVPNSPLYVEGIINLRGKVIPVINLRQRLDLEDKAPDTHTRIMVMELGGQTVGFVVDAVREVLRIPKSITEAPPDIGNEAKADFIMAVGKLSDRLLILLDLERLFREGDQADLRQMSNALN